MAIIVPVIRMYEGAHLPLDLIGGAALGVTVASAVNLLLGVPRHQG
jgi:undecaprenyl-diphosphatase